MFLEHIMFQLYYTHLYPVTSCKIIKIKLLVYCIIDSKNKIIK